MVWFCTLVVLSLQVMCQIKKHNKKANIHEEFIHLKFRAKYFPEDIAEVRDDKTMVWRLKNVSQSSNEGSHAFAIFRNCSIFKSKNQSLLMLFIAHWKQMLYSPVSPCKPNLEISTLIKQLVKVFSLKGK